MNIFDKQKNRTKVVGMPTLSAALNASIKLRLLSAGVRESYGIFSGR